MNLGEVASFYHCRASHNLSYIISAQYVLVTVVNEGEQRKCIINPTGGRKPHPFGIDKEKNPFLGRTWGGWAMKMRI